MRIECPKCEKKYEIPDELLPKDKESAFRCKDCTALIKIHHSSGQTEQEPLNKEKTPDGVKSEVKPAQVKGNGVRADGEALKKKILQSLTGVLPAMPQIIIKAQDIMSNQKSNLKQLAQVIATDQAISIRVLKLANSAYYGMSGKVTSLGQASVLLGTKRIGEVITMAGAFNFLDKRLKGYGLESGELWRHSLAVAVGSRLIANQKAPELENDAFSAGLIHDSGKIMMDQYIFEKREAINDFLDGGGQDLIYAERAVLGFDHAELGSEVCGNWGIPESLTGSIEHHHDPTSSPNDRLSHILHMADYISLTNKDGEAEEGTGDAYLLDAESLEFIGIKEEELERLRDSVSQIVEKIAGEVMEG